MELRDRLRNLESASAEIYIMNQFRKYFTIKSYCRQRLLARRVGPVVFKTRTLWRLIPVRPTMGIRDWPRS